MSNCIPVQKRGDVHVVYVDAASGAVLPISSHDETPVGGFPQTFTSYRELVQAFPNKEFKIFERPCQNPPIIRRSASIIEEAQTYLNNQNTSSPTNMPIQVKPQVSKTNTSAKEEIENFRKRLDFALRYASSDHAITLKIQLAIIDELLNEIFQG